MTVHSSETTASRFNAIRWHDSKLLALWFLRDGREEQVRISLQLLGKEGIHSPVELVFRHATFLGLEVDLDGKRVCSDDISGARCQGSSEWTRRLSAGSPHDHFDGYLHFEIILIPPGGTINILARDFTVASEVECSEPPKP